VLKVDGIGVVVGAVIANEVLHFLLVQSTVNIQAGTKGLEASRGRHLVERPVVVGLFTLDTNFLGGGLVLTLQLEGNIVAGMVLQFHLVANNADIHIGTKGLQTSSDRHLVKQPGSSGRPQTLRS
jgi:hypothetical protein